MTVCDIAILLLSGAAPWLVSQKAHWSRWGYVCGLAGQPFWCYTAITHHQWGILALSIWYAYAWGIGVRNHFSTRKLT